jgi:hypothetical protein
MGTRGMRLEYRQFHPMPRSPAASITIVVVSPIAVNQSICENVAVLIQCRLRLISAMTAKVIMNSKQSPRVAARQ